MIKRWMALLILVALTAQACALPVSAPTSICPPPGEITPTVRPGATASATLVVPALTITSAAKATKVVINTPTINAPASTNTQAPPTPTKTNPTKVPDAPTPLPMKYRLQPGTPVAVSGFVHADLGCSWMGLGGQVFALDSNPVMDLVVELGGTLNGQAVSQLSLTGTGTQWGPGGFEFTLANHPIDSSGTLWMRVLDLNGNPTSNRIYFTTYNDCSKNTILVNLTQLVPNLGIRQYLPLVGR